MNLKATEVLVAGGTGFLGSIVVEELKRIGIPCRVVSLDAPHQPEQGYYQLDFFQASDQEYHHLFETYPQVDVIVYALGPDDRVIPKGDALSFFVQRLVETPIRFFEVAKQYGVQRGVIFGSYFAKFDRELDGQLGEIHPYIKARTLQEQRLQETFPEMDWIFLELPFIFGVRKGFRPIWKDFFFDPVHFGPFVIFPKGGSTATVSAKHVGYAAACAAISGASETYIGLCDENWTYRQILHQMILATPKKSWIIEIPAKWVVPFGRRIDQKFAKEGRQSGLDHGKLMTSILNREFTMPETSYRMILSLEDAYLVHDPTIADEITASIQACEP